MLADDYLDKFVTDILDRLPASNSSVLGAGSLRPACYDLDDDYNSDEDTGGFELVHHQHRPANVALVQEPATS